MTRRPARAGLLYVSAERRGRHNSFVTPSAQQISQLEGLAVAIPWGFESFLPHQPSLTPVNAEALASARQATRRLSRRSPKGEGGRQSLIGRTRLLRVVE